MAFFDNIFPLIFLYVIWRLFSRSGRKPRAVPEPPPSAGQPDRPGDVRVNPADVLKQMLFGGGKTDARPRPEPAERTADAAGRRRTAAAVTPPNVSREKTPARTPPASEPPDKTPVRSREDRDGRPPRPVIRASRARLREAVLWSEILAPPKGLRDE